MDPHIALADEVDIECRKKPFVIGSRTARLPRNGFLFVCLKDGKIDSCSLRRKTEKRAPRQI